MLPDRLTLWEALMWCGRVDVAGRIEVAGSVGVSGRVNVIERVNVAAGSKLWPGVMWSQGTANVMGRVAATLIPGCGQQKLHM